MDFGILDFTSISLTKWNNAISDNINLIDFGLTAFDNGRTNIMWSGITLTPKDILFSMYRIGYNDVIIQQQEIQAELRQQLNLIRIQ